MMITIPIIIMIIIILIMIITKIFETSSRNTTRERRMEMPKVTFSPACIIIMIMIMNVTTMVVLILITTVANILNKYDNLEAASTGRTGLESCEIILIFVHFR